MGGKGSERSVGGERERSGEGYAILISQVDARAHPHQLLRHLTMPSMARRHQRRARMFLFADLSFSAVRLGPFLRAGAASLRNLSVYPLLGLASALQQSNSLWSRLLQVDMKRQLEEARNALRDYSRQVLPHADPLHRQARTRLHAHT